jgi:hypothetical protein
VNLLECHVLAGMRKMYDLKLPRVRSALKTISQDFPQPHPLISQVFPTDRRDLFVEKLGELINVSPHTEPPHFQVSLASADALPQFA